MTLALDMIWQLAGGDRKSKEFSHGGFVSVDFPCTRCELDGRSLPVLLGLLLTAAAAGCRSKTREVGPAEVPVVPVSHPVERVVTDYVDFTGRTDAVQSVNIIAAGHRLPGADALQGRIGGQSRGPLVRDRSAPVPGAV